MASSSEDAGAVSSDATPARVTQAELLKGTDWPALRLVSGDAWIDCDRPGAPPPGTVAAFAPPAATAPQADSDGSSSPKDVVAAALGVADATAAPAQASATAAGDVDETTVVADAPAEEPRPLVDLGFADVEAARSRSKVVLQTMVQNGFVDAASAAQVDENAIKLQPTTKRNSVRYFTDWALPQLDTLIDESNDPIEVWTTLDPNMQAAADRAIDANTPKGAQGALVAMDRDGAVRAMVGGRDYVSSIYNRATQAERQPGSAFKLFVYLAALESGMKPADLIVDEPVTINGWTPRNSTRTYAGPVTLREAFARSINTISAKIGAQLGFGTIADMARRFGITTRISTFPSMVLGTSDVRLIDMTRAFASVANQGVSVSPYAIRRVVTADGRMLYQHDGEEGRVLVAPWVAAGMTDLLQSAVLTGTGRAAQIGRPVAGKTGTTTSNKDGWFIGFSSGLTTGVWMGRDDARRVAGLQGGTAPARAFHDFMTVAVANRPVQQFQTEVPIPNWDLGDDGAQYVDENQMGFEPLVDENGNPLPNQPMETMPLPGTQLPPGGPVDQQWLDQVLPPGSQQQPGQPIRRPQPQPQPQVVRPQVVRPEVVRPQVVRPQQPRSAPPADPPEPPSETPQQ